MPRQINAKLKSFVGHMLEPFALVAIISLFILAGITIFNLSPITKTKSSGVLGVNTSTTVAVSMVGGTHNIVKEEEFSRISEFNYEYTASIKQRIKGEYSKPILQIVNNTSEKKDIYFSGSTLTSTSSDISLAINNQQYKLETKDGQTYSLLFSIDPSQSYTVYLILNNDQDVQFSEAFDLTVSVK